MKLYRGRPDNCEGRDIQEVRTYDLLDRLGIEYMRADHAAADTMEVCGEIDSVLDTRICKNLFLCNRQQTAFYLLMMPGEKPFKTKDLSSQLGVSRLSFAPESFMTAFLDLHPGSVSVLGLMNDSENRVQLVIDRAVLEQEYFGCHPCRNTSSIKIKMSDLTEKFLQEIHHSPVIVDLPDANMEADV